MTLEEVYSILESNIFYEQDSSRKFTFIDNSIHIDRRAFIPYSIYKENECFFLDPDTAIATEKELRIEIEKTSVQQIHLYGKTSGEKLLTLSS
jgi:hypothetical protein